MKLLKWLFHPLYLLLTIIAVAIYVNRDILFSPPTAADSKAGEVKSAPVAAAPRQAPEKLPIAAQAPVPQQAAPATPKQPQAENPNAISAPPAAPRQQEKAAAGAPKGADAGQAPSAQQTSALEQWRSARQLAWDGKLNEAVSAYQLLTERDPKNFDAFGELGNVYLQLGRWEAASESYHRAAVLLQGAGNSMMAWHLQRIVHGLDRERGERLRAALVGREPQ